MDEFHELKLQDVDKLEILLKKCTDEYFEDYLIRQIFTDQSYSQEYGGYDNRILKSIGKKYTDLFSIKSAAEEFGNINNAYISYIGTFTHYDFECNEKDTSELPCKIINEKVIANVIDKWGVFEYMAYKIYNPDEFKIRKLKVNLFYAITGAYAVYYSFSDIDVYMFLSYALNIDELISEYYHKTFLPLDLSYKNAVSILERYHRQDQIDSPVYDFGCSQYMKPDQNGNKIWKCTCTVTAWNIYVIIFAHSKKKAKQYSAFVLLHEHFEDDGKYFKNAVNNALVCTDNGKLYPYGSYEANKFLNIKQ